jgi:hypothetical protein
MKKIVVIAILTFGAQITFGQKNTSPVKSANTNTSVVPAKENPQVKQDTREKQTPEQRAERKAEKLNSEVNLTADQKVKVQAIFLQNIMKLDEVRQNTSLTNEQKKEEIKKANMERMKAIDAVLTKEQHKTLKENRKMQMENKKSE